MIKEKLMEGVEFKYKGKQIDNIESLYYDSYEGVIRFTYKENENTYVNVKCKPKDIELKAK